jgi:copper chaperone
VVITLQVDHIKFGGCANTNRKGLTKSDRICGATITMGRGRVDMVADGVSHPRLFTALAGPGYSEFGSAARPFSVKAKAVVFVSRYMDKSE